VIKTLTDKRRSQKLSLGQQLSQACRNRQREQMIEAITLTPVREAVTPLKMRDVEDY